MVLQTSGAISVRNVRNEFGLSQDKMSTFTSGNTDLFSGTIPSSASNIALSDFYGTSKRTARISVGKSSATYAPNRYGWGLANYTGFYHAEQGYNSAAFGSITRYQGLIGNNLVGIVTHDASESGSSAYEDDVHLEIFTTSSSNSGWTYMDVKLAGDFQYQSAGYIWRTFTRTAASHFGQAGGNGYSYQPTNTVYAWTFTGKDGTYWYGSNSHPTDNDHVRDLHNVFKGANGGNGYQVPYIRFR